MWGSEVWMHSQNVSWIVMVPSFKVKTLDHLLLSQKSHEASQLKRRERATAQANVGLQN